ncbi:MAG: hypothetical protein P4M01_04440 [Acidobacteriota bacterium]|nr:hypothetical protein [Acidobacteriota bacterium]
MDPRFAHDLPENYYFGGGGDTFLTPAALLLLLLAVVALLMLPRRYVVVPLLVAGVLLPFNNTLVIGTIHLPVLRLLLLAGWARVAMQKDLRLPRMNLLDKAVLVWGLSNAICYSLLWSSLSAAANRVGFLWTQLGTYFLLRIMIRNREDMLLAIKTLAWLLIGIAPLMLLEHRIGQNMFAILGSPLVSEVRNGSIRAEGPLQHPIIAGTIAAMMLPVFVGAWWLTRSNFKLYAAGCVGSLMMAYSSASSTPIVTCAAGIAALALWRFRGYLRLMRWSAVGLLLLAHLLMKAPVWMLLARVGGILGGSGYHRAMLIDGFVTHFSDWWLVGTRNNAFWGYDMWDVDNAFVGAGISGGLVTFLAFLAIVVFAFRLAGEGWHRAEEPEARFSWALGCCLFANTVGYFGIVYFDQSILLWYSVLVLVSVAAVTAPSEQPEEKPTALRSGVAGTWRDRRSRLGLKQPPPRIGASAPHVRGRSFSCAELDLRQLVRLLCLGHSRPIRSGRGRRGE